MSKIKAGKSTKGIQRGSGVHKFEASARVPAPWGQDCERCPWCELPLTTEWHACNYTTVCLQITNPENPFKNDPLFPQKKTLSQVILKWGYKHFALTGGGRWVCLAQGIGKKKCTSFSQIDQLLRRQQSRSSLAPSLSWVLFLQKKTWGLQNSRVT